MTNLYQNEPVRIGPIANAPTVLRRFGVNPEKVFTEAGISLELLEDPDNLISFSARSHLIQLCCEHTQCDHFGLLLGEETGISTLGLIGYLALNSPDVRTALDNLIRHFHLQSRASMLSRKLGKDRVFFGYSIYQSGAEALSQIEDGAVAILYNVLRSICGPKWKPVEVCFAHRVPSNLDPYRKIFGDRLRFDAEHSGFYFELDWLDQAIETADPGLHHILNKQVEQLEARYGADFPAQVRRMIMIALPMGQASADHISALFTIHTRTLNRRLNSHGTNFKALADEVRYELAQQLISTSDMTLGEVSEILGYADSSAFTKAYKRWSGQTPSCWRAQEQAIS